MMKSQEEQSRKYRFNLRHLLFNKTIIKKPLEMYSLKLQELQLYSR